MPICALCSCKEEDCIPYRQAPICVVADHLYGAWSRPGLNRINESKRIGVNEKREFLTRSRNAAALQTFYKLWERVTTSTTTNAPLFGQVVGQVVENETKSARRLGSDGSVSSVQGN